MVYLWKIPEDYPDKLIGEYVKDDSPDRFVFHSGGVVTELGKPSIEFDADPCELRKYADLANSAMVPLINDALADFLLREAKADIQLIDVSMTARGKPVEGYRLLNIVNKVIGLDKQLSRFTLIPGTDQIMSFQSLAYMPKCLGGHSLARDSEYSSNLIISQELGQKLKKINFQGVGLYLPQEVY